VTALLVAAAVLALLVTGAVAGPRLLAAAAPTFTARPRLGIAVWTAAAVLWTLALLMLGPLLAWGMTGPALPGTVGTVCRRCLAAANPFPGSPWVTGVPVAALLGVPAALAVALLARAGWRSVRAGRTARAHVRAVRAVGQRRTVSGYLAWVLPTRDRLAYSMPTRRAGVFLSRGTLDALGPDELAAVVAHERAHLSQRHHALLGLLEDLRVVVGRSPLVAAAAPAVAALAEMAADDAARRTAGTRAVAGALLSLACPPTTPPGVPAGALHAAAGGASWRTRRLVQLPTTAPRWRLALVGGYLAAVLAGVVVVAWPYARVLADASC
jgi:Zn-dependent protease with chaperone function